MFGNHKPGITSLLHANKNFIGCNLLSNAGFGFKGNKIYFKRCQLKNFFYEVTKDGQNDFYESISIPIMSLV